MKYYKKLLGEKIYLSPMTTEDAEKFTEWLNNFQTTDYIGRSGAIITLEGEKQFLEEHIKGEATFGIIEIETDEIVGTIFLEKIDHLNRTGTLGIFIGDIEARNKGYGTEAIRLILDYGFNYLNLNNICLDLLESNERALACYKKCGFKEYGRRRKCIYLNGKYYDRIRMDILAEEFKDKYIKNRNI